MYVEKSGIIQDKKCKNCNKLILKEKDFCDCGFFRKAEKDSIYWSIMITSLISACLVIITIALQYNNFDTAFNHGKKSTITDINSLSPLNIQMISCLQDSPYYEYIQNIYLEQGSENVLMVLIKPSFWETMSYEKKQNLLNRVNFYWNDIYKQHHPFSKLAPIVKYANPE